MEIERKWLFDEMPKGETTYKLVDSYDYKQAYISIDPEIRIRAKKHDNESWLYKLCIKSKGDLSRIEIEKNLSEQEFKELMQISHLTNNMFINKRVHKFNYNGYELFISKIECNNNSFIYGEIEFASEDKANNFKIPDWFGKEVTYDKSYKMCNYWKNNVLNRKDV